MFDSFDTKSRRTVVLAQEEARSSGSSEVTTSHLLYALAWIPDTGARAVLAALGVTPEEIRDKFVQGGVEHRSTPLSSGLKRVLTQCGLEASRSGVATKPVDLLAGLVQIGEGSGVDLLEALGVSQVSVKEMLERYGWEASSDSGSASTAL